PGSRVPTLKELCAMFELSTGSAVRGINELVERGLLEVRHGAGTFVRDRRDDLPAWSEELRIALFIVANDPSQYCAHALCGVQDLAQQHHAMLQTRYISHEEMNEAILRRAAAETDALLFLGDYDPFINRLPERIPAVGFEFQNSFNRLCSTVTLDPVDAALTAVEFFRERGCRRVRLISHPETPFQKLRGELFALRWRESGGELIELPSHPYRLAELGDVFTDPEAGYLFVSGTTCCNLMCAHRQKNGGEIARERTILSIDGKSRLIPYFPPVNTIGIDYYEAGCAAFGECLRRIGHPGSSARRIYLPGRLFTIDED
ncbi:MAG: GntR family transcriptional regulator, partial [Victivallaceae bacterium]